jgi:hypothetical protein
MSRALDSENSPGGCSPYLPNVTSCAEHFEAGEGVAKVLRNRVLLSLHESGAYGLEFAAKFSRCCAWVHFSSVKCTLMQERKKVGFGMRMHQDEKLLSSVVIHFCLNLPSASCGSNDSH